MPIADGLSSSLEDYLETISLIVAEKQVARVKEISKRLKVNMSSVSGALKLLTERGLINYAPYENITLTSKGQMLARQIIIRHNALKTFLMKVLTVKEVLADQTACKMEHALSPEVLKRFMKFLDFIENCPRGGFEWISCFGYHCTHDKAIRECEYCMNSVVKNLKTFKSRKSAGGD
jgi:DtxR family Mn-dependent transcriptional regulator